MISALETKAKEVRLRLLTTIRIQQTTEQYLSAEARHSRDEIHPDCRLQEQGEGRPQRGGEVLQLHVPSLCSLEDLPSAAATRDGTSGGERFSQSPAELRQGGGSKGSSPERQEGPGVSAEGLL